MNIILLSGGSGKRLWPLSNEIRSKQFIKIFKTEEGYESMVQRVYRQIHQVDPSANITIATSLSQVSSIHNQLHEDVGICVEPCRRDTFGAIALACAYLKDVKGIKEEEGVVICPCDSYVDDHYFESIKTLCDWTSSQESNLYLMGMEPTYPSEKYGYIMPYENTLKSKVRSFKEKPTEDKAKEYIEQGALWNGGVFAFQLGYLLNKAHELIDFESYQDLYDQYETIEKISFDFAVVEKEEKISVLRYQRDWKDLGTWNTLTEAMEEPNIGPAIFDQKSENVHVLNELDVPVLCMGLKDMIIACSPEGILVSDKKESSYIKPYVDQIEQPIMFAEKSWGEYKVIDVQEESMTIKVTLNQGSQMNYHAHQFRDEVWTVVSGIGMANVNGRLFELKIGDTIKLPRGCKHTIYAQTKLQLIEVQTGKDIDVKDKQKF